MSPGARNYNLRAAPSSAMFPRCEHIVQVHDRVGWVERKRNPSTALQHGTPYAVIAGRALVEALTGRSSLRGGKGAKRRAHHDRSKVGTLRFAHPTHSSCDNSPHQPFPLAPRVSRTSNQMGTTRAAPSRK